MVSATALYLLLVLDISGHFVPVIVAGLSLRRALRSSGFNRLVYAYVALFSAGSLAILANVGWNSLTLHVAALLLAWSTLALWLCLRVTLRPTRSRPSAYTPPETKPVAEADLPPIPFFSTWIAAARSLQG